MDKLPNMKSGFSILNEKEECPVELKSKIESIILDMMEQAVMIGVAYSQASGRNNLSSMDILYSLQYQAREYCTEDNIAEQMEKDEDEGEDDEDDEDDEDEENDEDEGSETDNDINEDEEGDLEYFVRAKNVDELTTKMNKYHDEWNEWQPENYIQHILKKSINDKFILEPNTH